MIGIMQLVGYKEVSDDCQGLVISFRAKYFVTRRVKIEENGDYFLHNKNRNCRTVKLLAKWSKDIYMGHACINAFFIVKYH
jgi:hypothetical protein